MDGFLGRGVGSSQIKFAKARTTVLGVSLQDIVHDCCVWGRQPRPLVRSYSNWTLEPATFTANRDLELGNIRLFAASGTVRALDALLCPGEVR